MAISGSGSSKSRRIQKDTRSNCEVPNRENVCHTGDFEHIRLQRLACSIINFHETPDAVLDQSELDLLKRFADSRPLRIETRSSKRKVELMSLVSEGEVRQQAAEAWLAIWSPGMGATSQPRMTETGSFLQNGS
ncbi:uncharacterized protein Z519_07424 [Cladophialophora bantiana CBS 173.52]|uniref:Uncharacterized protein n=1 Tax=Cladophialophora bantiana (strain ATCC 10958 / CBS 173.52 / CDC B-1940 / NIH 8579) TaxID=1442370 RepID=A0A0D2HNK4_CLAB1|nr:uncharacterized protein Z519_07424 [Cladophialophora bantiana CBS 173.52]KIW92440.1 hypothetical protein Z519_07424 [Cladophialophora bantiana CBS 173.52]